MPVDYSALTIPSPVHSSSPTRPTLHPENISFSGIRGYAEWCIEDRLSPRRRSIRASGLEGEEAAVRC